MTLRTYRLALVTDPSYATFFGAEQRDRGEGHADEPGDPGLRGRDRDPAGPRSTTPTGPTSTPPALATEPNGPCGAAACFTAGPTGRLRRRHAQPQPDRARPARRRQQLRHRPPRPRRQRWRRGRARRRRRRRQGARLHRPAHARRRLLRRRLRRARDGPPVRRQPHLQRHAAELLRRQPQRRQLGRAGQRIVHHGLRRHLPAGRPAAAQRPVLVAAQLHRDHDVRRVEPPGHQRGADGLAARTSTPTATRSPSASTAATPRRSCAAPTTRRPDIKAAIEAIAGWPAARRSPWRRSAAPAR